MIQKLFITDKNRRRHWEASSLMQLLFGSKFLALEVLLRYASPKSEVMSNFHLRRSDDVIRLPSIVGVGPEEPANNYCRTHLEKDNADAGFVAHF